MAVGVVPTFPAAVLPSSALEVSQQREFLLNSFLAVASKAAGRGAARWQGSSAAERALLGTLWHEPQAVEVVKGNCAKERADILADVTGGRVTPVVITARLDSAQSAQAYAEAVRVFVIPYS